MKFNDVNLSIIQAYAPTTTADEKDVCNFYKTLEEAHKMADETLFVIGDFNAQVGLPKKQENIILGQYGYGTRTPRGEKLIQYANEHNLSIMNTFFKKKPSKKWTWISPDQRTKNEIDFILSNKPKNISNVEVLNNVNFSTDHRMVRATYLFKCSKSRTNYTSNTKRVPRSEEDKNKYIENLITNLQQTSEKTNQNVQNYYNSLTDVIKESQLSEKEKPSDKVSTILSEHTKQLLTRRSELLRTKCKSKETKQEISQLFKMSNKAIRKDYNNYRKIIIERNLKQYRSTKRAFKELSSHTRWIQCLRTESKENITRQDIIKCATEFYKNLYDIAPTHLTEELQIDTGNEFRNGVDETITPITEKEVTKYISHMKTEKSAGPDGIKSELLKIGAPLLAKPIAHLFNMVLNSGNIPEQWKTSDIILLYKKGDPKDVANYRPISLLSTIYKLFTSIILGRINTNIEQLQPIEQAGFRSGFSTMDHIHVMEQILEKHKEFNTPLYVAFIDYAKAFDTISHNSIWEALRGCNVEETYIQILKNIYKDSTSRVKMERKGEEIAIRRGVRQGDPISPKLFIAVLQNIFIKLGWQREGITVLRKHLSHLRFADDIVLFAETSSDLRKMISALNEESQKVGLMMNVDKTKLMTNHTKRPIFINNMQLEYVDRYIYLGKQMSFEKNNMDEEIERRINNSWKKFWSLKEILKGDYSVHLKKIVMDTCILPCLTYACQTWSYTTNITNKITTCQRSMERSILNIRKIHKIKSECIRNKTKVTDALHYALKLKWRWAGHVARCSDKRWTIVATNWKGPPSGKRKPGQPRKRWADDIVKTAGRQWMQKAKNREEWSKLEEAYTQKGVPIPDYEH